MNKAGIAALGGRASIDDIFEAMEVQYSRFDPMPYGSNNSSANLGPQSFKHLNNNAMQLSASCNLFGKAALRSDPSTGGSAFINTESDEEHRWIIQTKFETPMLNFNHISANSGNLSIPTFGSESVPRGMWHQYGKIPEENEGVYLQVGPIPRNWLMAHQNRTQAEAENFGDLTKVCGFSNEPVKLGRLAETKTVYEAVVAVPFVIEKGRRKFFELDRSAVTEAVLSGGQRDDASGLGGSVRKQVRKMRKYIFPPTFDFINNRDVNPIAMYIFEFKHKLDRQDLADIWQNIPPKISETFEESVVKITHPLLAKELLGGGRPNDITSHQLQNELRWMVFKVKQRAAKNYFEKIAERNSSLQPEANAAPPGEWNEPGTIPTQVPMINLPGMAIGNLPTQDYIPTAAIIPPTGDQPNRIAQFNWPYDFFSLVELVQIDAELEWIDADFSAYKEDPLPPIGIQADSAAIIVGNLDLSDVLEIGPGFGPEQHLPGGITTLPGVTADFGVSSLDVVVSTIIPLEKHGPGKTQEPGAEPKLSGEFGAGGYEGGGVLGNIVTKLTGQSESQQAQTQEDRENLDETEQAAIDYWWEKYDEGLDKGFSESKAARRAYAAMVLRYGLEYVARLLALGFIWNG